MYFFIGIVKKYSGNKTFIGTASFYVLDNVAKTFIGSVKESINTNVINNLKVSININMYYKNTHEHKQHGKLQALT